MALEYGPFNGLENAWDAYDFAEYLKLFYGNGVFPNPSNNLQVVTNANMQTKVSVGVGFVEGHKIKNTSEFILQHDVADGVLKRIDRVVMRANFLQNKGEIIVKKGTPASSPVAPTLVRNTDYYELALADVLISNGATTITQSNITDQRLNTALCGVVATNITQLDTTTLALQYQDAFEQMTIDQQQDFEAWIATLEDILDENVAATLASRLLVVESDVSDIDTQITTLQNNNQKATQAEAIAGTDNTKVMTPLRVNNVTGTLSSLLTNAKNNLTSSVNEVFSFASAGLKAIDTRSVNSTPEYYYNRLINENIYSFTEFKMNTVIGIPENVEFSRVETKVPFRDFSGGGVVQLAYSNGEVYSRVASSNTSWGAWKKILNQDDYDVLFQSVSNGKALVAAAITGKGVQTAADASFQTLANNITTITTGSQQANGTLQLTNSYFLEVSGLPFTPTSIVFWDTQDQASKNGFATNTTGTNIGRWTFENTLGSSFPTFTTNGFRVSVYDQNLTRTYGWIAYE